MLFGFGKAKPGNDYPAIYLIGVINGQYGFFRSDDAANSWVRINDDAHQYGLVLHICGDMQEYGRVYIGTHGRGNCDGSTHVIAFLHAVHVISFVPTSSSPYICSLGTEMIRTFSFILSLCTVGYCRHFGICSHYLHNLFSYEYCPSFSINLVNIRLESLVTV